MMSHAFLRGDEGGWRSQKWVSGECQGSRSVAIFCWTALWSSRKLAQEGRSRKICTSLWSPLFFFLTHKTQKKQKTQGTWRGTKWGKIQMERQEIEVRKQLVRFQQRRDGVQLFFVLLPIARPKCKKKHPRPLQTLTPQAEHSSWLNSTRNKRLPPARLSPLAPHARSRDTDTYALARAVALPLLLLLQSHTRGNTPTSPLQETASRKKTKEKKKPPPLVCCCICASIRAERLSSLKP